MKKVIVGIATAVVLLGCGGGDESDDGNNNDGNNTTYTLTVNLSPATGGTVTVNGTAYTNPTTHNAGTSVTVTAAAAANYTFAGWTGASTATTPTVTVTINDNRTLTANFTVSNSGGGNQFNPNITYGELTDSRDGKKYKTVVIGTQTWMAENLNYVVADGGSKCYRNHADSCAKYGRLYTWADAMGISISFNNIPWGGSDVKHQGICPVGWHVPSDAEWEVLVKHVDPNISDDYRNKAGTKLKSSTDWIPRRDADVPIGTNEHGFSALPGGYGFDNTFSYVGIDGTWWSATEYYDVAYAWYRDMGHSVEDVFRHYRVKEFLNSLRCLAD